MDIRAKIQKRMEEQGVKPYALALRLKGKVGQRTLYDFLSGEADMTSTKLGHVLDALGISLIYFGPYAYETPLGKKWARARAWETGRGPTPTTPSPTKSHRISPRQRLP